MELLEPRLMLTASWQNACNALDVSGDGYVVPLDALLSINQINTNGAGPVPTPSPDKSPPPFYDVNGDNFISPIDVLLVINLLNNLPTGPMFSLGLARDTAPKGSTNQDKVTFDDRIAGRILTPTGVISLRARVDDGAWFDVVPVCGSFEFRSGLATSGQDDGTHRVEMTALDPWHRVWQDSMQFVLDTQRPVLSLALNPDDDSLPLGDGITEKWNAGLVGTTEPGLSVNILPVGAQASADASGKFSVASLPLATGTNSFQASAYDAAGNLATTATSIERTFCFDPQLSGWTASESGGSDSGRGGVTASSCQAVLREGDSFQVALTTDFVVPSVLASVQFSYHDLKFDASASGTMRDAFEVAVVDASGVPLVPTFQADRDAFLNAVEGLSLAYPNGVELDGSKVTIGLAGVPAGTAAKIVFRLLGNDQDHDSSVWIDDFSLVAGAQPTGPTPSDSASALSRQSIDLSALSDVSASIRPTYRRTSLQATSARVHADLLLQNSGQYAVDGPLYVAVADLSDPSVVLTGYDGLMPDGTPYLEVPLVGSANSLAPGEASGSRDLAFYNPQGVAFTYDLKVLGHLNRGPTITSLPVNQAVVGRAFQYSVKAEDAESDPLVFTLVSGPSAAVLDSATGNLTWVPTSADVGSHAVEIRVADSRGGVISQAFTLSVVDSLPNRPPIITSRPVTDASVVTSFDLRDVPVGRDPVAIAVGDFDGTGAFSLVTADPGDQIISLAAGNGSGSYAPATSTSVGEPAVLYRTFRDGITLPVNFPYPLRTSAVYGIAKGDFDGDGFLDLAGTAINDISYVGTVGWILIWHGNGDGTFQDPVYIDLPRYPHVTPYGILSRDFDRDGDLDLIVAAGTSTETGLWLLRGKGDGTFGPPTKVMSGIPGGIVQTADLNGDGNLDLVSGGGTQVQIHLGDGTGAFTAGSVYTLGNGVIDLAIGDLDGDGKPDLAVASYGNATLAMLRNDGTGNFFDLQILTGFQPTGVMIADFNGNGRGEIALSTVSGTFRLVERQDDGTYRMLIDDSAYGQVMSYTFSQRGAATDNSPMDINGDGKPDVVFNANWEAREIALVGVNKGDGTFTMTRYVGSIGSGTPGVQRSSSISKGALFGDFNNDGVSDLVVASENEYRPGSVNIHLGTTPGKVDAPIITDRTPVSGHTSSNVVTGDFTGDGLPDAIQVGGSLAVFPNQGDGTLGRAFPGTGYISGSGEFFSNHARVADFNADGILDVVYSAGDGVQAGPFPRYIVSLGLGNGTFQPTVFSNPGYHAAQNMSVADFNRDGLPDIAGWIQDYAHIEIWLNDPSNPGHFRLVAGTDGNPIASSIGPLTAYPSNGFTAADFTGDGIVDLVAHVVGINADNPERQYVFPGNGDGTFAAPLVSHPGYYESNEMVAADLNRDGKQDLVSIVNGTGSYIQLGNGDGTFAPPSRYAEANGNSVAVSDVNRDGVLDIVSVSSYYTQDPALLIGRGDGTFDPAERYAAAVPSANTSVSVTDLNQDGAADIVYFDAYLALVATMYGNGPGLHDVATADINGDGRRDVVAVSTRNDRVKLLLGNGDNTFSRTQDLFTGASPVAVAVADLNGDGRVEIVTANATGTVTLFVNQGDGKFQSTNYPVGRRPGAITLADVTGDGAADIIVANEDGASVSLLAGDGAGSFAAAQEIPVGIHPSTVAAWDVTGDGVRDLVLGSAPDEAFVILKGLSSGAFQAGVPVPTQASFSDLVVGDVTGDGTPDLVVANPTEQQVSLYAGLGNGKFQTPQPIRIDHAPTALALRDLNGDGREDIVAANRDSDTATIISSRPTESQPYAYRVTAADPDGDSVTYALANAPGGMSIDPA
ncbi:MAG: FG-GAP-like repeat-containing protein, partial [Aureliella sp.]